MTPPEKVVPAVPIWYQSIDLNEKGASCPSGFPSGPEFRRDAGAFQRDPPIALAQRWSLRRPRTDIVRDALLVAEPLEVVSKTV